MMSGLPVKGDGDGAHPGSYDRTKSTTKGDVEGCVTGREGCPFVGVETVGVNQRLDGEDAHVESAESGAGETGVELGAEEDEDGGDEERADGRCDYQGEDGCLGRRCQNWYRSLWWHMEKGIVGKYIQISCLEWQMSVLDQALKLSTLSVAEREMCMRPDTPPTGWRTGPGTGPGRRRGSRMRGPGRRGRRPCGCGLQLQRRVRPGLLSV